MHIPCTPGRKQHLFKDVGLNLGECKFCGLMIMHSGEGHLWTPVEDAVLTECDIYGHQWAEAHPGEWVCQRCGEGSYDED